MLVAQRRLACELLEDRRMLSGMTLITHGFQLSGTYPAWVDAMAESVIDRIAEETSSSTDEVSWYHMTFSETQQGSPLFTIADRSGKRLDETTTGEVVVTFDWSDVSTLGAWPTLPVAEELAQALVSIFPSVGIATPLAELPMHLIGHSRGGSVIGEVARQLGELGVWVEQISFLDPHPLNAFEGLGEADAPAAVYENVVFSDDYWQNLDSPVGQPVAGSFEVFLSGDPMAGGYDSNHSDMHLWYHGTIDVDGVVSDGDVVGLDPDAAGWYAGNRGPRDGIGYHYSRIVGGTRPDSGLSTYLGGGGSRVEIASRSAATWSNLLELTTDATSIDAGDSIDVSYFWQDVDSAADVTFYFDADMNPYTANQLPAGNPIGLTQTGETVGSGGAAVSSVGVPAGDYWLMAEVTDGSHTRYAYAPDVLTVAFPTFGSIESTTIDIDVLPGDSWYSLETAYDALLTLERLQGDVKVTLFDADFMELAGPADRIDYSATGESGFYVKLGATTSQSTTLRLTNLVREEGGAVTVYGTNAADRLELAIGSSLVVTINDAEYLFDSSAIGTLDFDGGAERDGVVLYGSSEAESATLWPDHGEFQGSVTVGLDGVESIVAHMGGGGDTVVMHGSSDSAAADVLRASPGRAEFTGPASSSDGLDLEADGYQTLRVYAEGGPADVAYLYDSRADDHFYADANQASFSRTGIYEVSAFGFPFALAYAGDGHDSAELHDSGGDDELLFYRDLAKLYDVAGTYFRRTKAFEEMAVYADAGSGAVGDVAYLHDSPDDDEFRASPGSGTIELNVRTVNNVRLFDTALAAVDFDYVHAYARNGGIDSAWLDDSPGNDTLLAKADQTRFYNADPANWFNVRAKLFEHVYASAGFGHDVAYMYDSSSRDTFIGRPDSSQMRGLDMAFDNRAASFDEVYAIAGYGGEDDAQLYDSDQIDHLEADLPKSDPYHWATVSSAAGSTLNYLYRIRGFETAAAHSVDAVGVGDESDVDPGTADWLAIDDWD